MNIKAEAKGSYSDSVKWLVVAALVVIGVVANQIYSTAPLLYRVIALLALAGVALFISAKTAKGRSLLELLLEARNEIRKVVWPTRQETINTTLIVVAVVLVMALILWGLDSLLGWLVSLIVG